MGIEGRSTRVAAKAAFAAIAAMTVFGCQSVSEEREMAAPDATPAKRMVTQGPAKTIVENLYRCPVKVGNHRVSAVGQITALRQLAASAPITVEEAVARFAGAPKAIVARHLETLAILGEVRPLDSGRYAAALVTA